MSSGHGCLLDGFDAPPDHSESLLANTGIVHRQPAESLGRFFGLSSFDALISLKPERSCRNEWCVSCGSRARWRTSHAGRRSSPGRVARTDGGPARRPGAEAFDAPLRRRQQLMAWRIAPRRQRAGRRAPAAHIRSASAFGTGAPGTSPRPRPSVLDEGRGVARVLLLLLDRLLFLRRVLRLLLACLRGLMGHGSLLWIAETMAPRHYRPLCRGAQVPR